MGHRHRAHGDERDFCDLFDVEDRIDLAFADTRNLAEFGYAVLVNVHREVRLGHNDQLLAVVDVRDVVVLVTHGAIQIALLGIGNRLGVVTGT